MPFDTPAPAMPLTRTAPSQAIPTLLAEVHRHLPDQASRRAVLARAEEIARGAGRALRGRAARRRMLEHFASTDATTGLLNRRGLRSRLAERLAEARRHNEPGVLIFVDLDSVAAIAGRFGAPGVDAALLMVAEGLRHAVRADDSVGHLGAGSFGVLISRIDHEAALGSAARLAQAIARLTLVFEGEAERLAVSVGLAPFAGNEPAEALLDREVVA
ncbi:GGDEF domain-containing protein [Elioraea sp.]|uniref:GGDEF domain-containing protein n=1 Tax=Elioraea sp. TaxID=2185103 RepID=UPI0025C473CD|nr:GGDEF domain-containing protein [Elioraea sp.]